MNSLYCIHMYLNHLLDLTIFLSSTFCFWPFVFDLTLFFETWVDSAAEIEGFENSRIITETYSTSFFKAFSSRVVTFLFCTRHKLSCRTRLSFRNTRLKVDVLYILSNVFCQKMPNFTLKVPKILPQIFWLVLLKILAVNSFSF